MAAYSSSARCLLAAYKSTTGPAGASSTNNCTFPCDGPLTASRLTLYLPAAGSSHKKQIKWCPNVSLPLARSERNRVFSPSIVSLFFVRFAFQYENALIGIFHHVTKMIRLRSITFRSSTGGKANLQLGLFCEYKYVTAQ